MAVKHLMDSILSDNPETDTEAYEVTLESFKALVADGSEGLAKYVKELQAIATIQENEAKELAEMAKKTAKKAENAMAQIAQCLTVMGLEEVQAGPYKFKFKKGSTVTEVDEAELPEAYWTTKAPPPVRKPFTKPELKKLVDGGISIKGVRIVQNPPKLELK